MAEAEHHQEWLCATLNLRYRPLPIEVPAAEPGPEPVAVAAPDGRGYQRLLEHNAARYVRALEIISDPGRQPTLYHCAAGKDRTGVLTALLLSGLDVEPAAIVADYAASEADSRRIIDRFRADSFYGPSAAAVPADYRLNRRVMASFLDLMGGVPGLQRWLLDHGFDQASLQRLRAGLTDPAHPSTD